MKKIINEPENVVRDMLSGMAASHPSLLYTESQNIISRREKKCDKVGLISGGGAGHEPAHAGYVGYGMLDAAISGNVFASPGPEAIMEGIRLADSGRGVLMIVKNYSGDIMNFETARELIADEGIETDYVVVKDDVAVQDSTFSTGRRGIAGTVFVHKIAGAAAERGDSLSEVKRIAQKTSDNVRSMGMAMSSCILPAVGHPGFELGENEMEYGIGIHGEPGIYRETIRDAAGIAEVLTAKILDDYDFTGSSAACMINGLGSVPIMELYILSGEVHRILRENGISVEKTYVGNFMTSLEMAGSSVSLLKLDDELKELLAAPSDTPAFRTL